MSYGPLPYRQVVPRDSRAPTMPDDEDLWWLDGEDSALCAACAVQSDNEDEVPQFRPKTSFRPGAGEYCDQCSFQWGGADTDDDETDDGEKA